MTIVTNDDPPLRALPMALGAMLLVCDTDKKMTQAWMARAAVHNPF
ncbi:MAG: hypothetical protein ABGY24_14840 [bacterium]